MNEVNVALSETKSIGSVTLIDQKFNGTFEPVSSSSLTQ
ncbi:hypothetical protein C427_5227 [Paraglaciecola psychrophila 170]|uniref:Uncharacterized protein n=1 Tax=Paraglaciecola psychrophila 170 TaxID=1129794 RepID=K6YV03_9ALTE|nr:hypothetical protein C427_5227 [Paraglaciecola psychrophila 170]GAC36544.1 hypothetical protein GPSY_0906 [Paraglaciecola psychrophila 170]